MTKDLFKSPNNLVWHNYCKTIFKYLNKIISKKWLINNAYFTPIQPTPPKKFIERTKWGITKKYAFNDEDDVDTTYTCSVGVTYLLTYSYYIKTITMSLQLTNLSLFESHVILSIVHTKHIVGGLLWAPVTQFSALLYIFKFAFTPNQVYAITGIY